MTIHIHFWGDAPVKKLCNVANLRDSGNSTVIVENAYGGGATEYRQVHHIAIEPERAEEE